MAVSLNPFGTGQCLSTISTWFIENLTPVSIPLEQGSVFRLLISAISLTPEVSQSLWNRAVSFDITNCGRLGQKKTSQSLWNRAVSFDKVAIIWLIAQSVSIPLEQGSVFRQLKRLLSKGWTFVSIPLEQGSVFRPVQ